MVRVARATIGPALSLVLIGGVAAAAQPLAATPPRAFPSPPQELFDGLFTAVQSAGIYPDSKLFADAVPQAAPAEILAQYRAQRPDSVAALRAFVEAHFVLPAEAATIPATSATPDITAHIDGLWAQLTRTTVTPPRWSRSWRCRSRTSFRAGGFARSTTGTRTSRCSD